MLVRRNNQSTVADHIERGPVPARLWAFSAARDTLTSVFALASTPVWSVTALMAPPSPRRWQNQLPERTPFTRTSSVIAIASAVTWPPTVAPASVCSFRPNALISATVPAPPA